MLPGPVSACLTLGNYALLSLFFSEREKILSADLDVSADLDPRNRRNDPFQSVTALEDSLAGEITAVTPKHVEQIIDDWSGRALLPLLEQLKPGDTLLV
jgi:hypothetical protein